MPKYIPRQIEGRDVVDNAVDHTAVAESFIHLATAAPTKNEDEGTGYAVGCLWIDYSNGETYTCIDSTDEAAKWAAQDGSDDVNISPAWQGTTYAYELGGATPGPTAMSDKISRWPVAAPYPTADVGELAQGMAAMGAYLGPGDVGFTAGGYNHPGNSYYAEVTSFPTAGPPVSTSDQGDLNRGGWAYGGDGWSPTEGYTFGGQDGPPGSSYQSTIDKFTFAAPFTAADVAEMSDARDFTCSHDDATHTYIGGGWDPGTSDKIERFQKSTTTDSADVGELAESRYGIHGNSDVVGGYGYASGGGGPPPLNERDVIQRFPFASSTPSSDIGESSATNAYGSQRGASTLTHGHTAHRYGPGGNGIDRFAFGSSTSGAEIGEVANLQDNEGMICV